MNAYADNRVLDRAEGALPGSDGGGRQSETSFLQRLLRELGGHLSAAGLSPAEMFRAIVSDRTLMYDARNVLQVLAMPSQQPKDALCPGDWMLRAVPGTGDVGHLSVLASGDLRTPSALASERITAEGTLPGYYGLVIEAGAFPHSRSRPFARRLLDSRGRVPPHTIFLRPRYPEVGELTPEWSEETGTVQPRARRAMAPEGRKLLPTDVRYLSFEGGGGKGSAFLGALAALVEPGIEIFDARLVPGATTPDFFLNTQKIQGIAGTSAGAITAALIASGYGLRELYGFMTNTIQLERFYDEPRDAKGNLERLVYSKAKTQIESRPAPRRDWVQDWVVSSSPLWRKFLIEPQLFQLGESARRATLLAVPLLIKPLVAGLGPMFPSALKTITRNPEVLAKYLDNLTYDLGLFSGVEIWRVLDLMIGSKPTPAPGSGPLPDRRGITFAQHKALHGVELRLTGTNLETGESRLFCASKTPEFRVIDAVRISLSLPFFFKPFVISVGPHRGTWIDGGILNNNPIHAFDDPDALGTINPNLLGLRLGVDYPSPENPMRIRKTGDLAQALWAAMSGMSELGQIRTPQERAQTISLHADPLTTFEFTAGKDVLHAVCCRAARQTLAYFGLAAKGAGSVIPALFGQSCP